MEDKTAAMKIRFITASGFFIFTAMQGIFIAGCENNKTEKIIPAEKEEEKTISEFTLVKVDGTEKKWTMKAEEAVFEGGEGEPEILHVRNFNIKFNSEDKKAEDTVLTGKRGTYNRQTEDIETEGPVRIRKADKKIRTSNVIWDPEKEKFFTEENITITDNEGTIKGRGMEATVDLEKITIKEKISGTIENNE